MSRLIILLIKSYRLTVGQAWFPSCRFIPSCSAYAEEAVARHGAIRGISAALKRLSRCRPGSPAGPNPVE